MCWWVDGIGEIHMSRIWEFYLGYWLWADVDISGYETNLTLTFFDESYYTLFDVVYLIDGTCVASSQLEPGTGIPGIARRFATMDACALASGDGSAVG